MIRMEITYNNGTPARVEVLHDDMVTPALANVVHGELVEHVVVQMMLTASPIMSVKYEAIEPPPKCTYTHSHTRAFCGNERCRQH